jgi:hypothetical protein
MTTENGSAPVPTVSFSGRYLAMVGGLLVLIIAMLAVLWVRERGRRVDAEAQVMELRRESQKLNLMLSLMTRSGAAEPSVQPFQRQDQVPVAVTLDGARRDAYRLPAAAAERFGFREGDVILVVGAGAGSTSAPATTGPGR